jgi:chromosome segregation ATPase
VLESVLNSRIDQAIAITPPTDESRIALLEAIREIEAYPERVASFSDCLIDYVVSLSKELNETKLQIARLEERPTHKKSRHQSGNQDYEECLRLLRASRDHLAESLEELIAQNANLRRVRKQDRAILIRQNEMLAKLRSEAESEENVFVEDDRPIDGCSRIRREFQRISKELDSLTQDVSLRERHHRHRRH